MLRPWLALFERHHVVVDWRERLRLEVVPEPLHVGDNTAVHQDAVAVTGADPSGGDPHFFVVGKPVEVGAEDDLRFEPLPQQFRAVCSRGNHLVGRRTDRRLLEANPRLFQLQLTSEHLVDWKDLEQPPGGREHRLLLPFGRRARLSEANRDVADRLTGKRGTHDVVQPAVPLLVSREDDDRSPVWRRARLDQLRRRFLREALSHVRGFAESCFDHDRPLLLQTRNDFCPHAAPELVDLRGDLDLLVDDGLGLLHIQVLDRNLHSRSLKRRGKLPSEDGFETRVGLLEVDAHLRRLERAASKLTGQLVQFVDCGCGLAGRAPPADEATHVVLHVVERRAVLPTLPHVWEPLGELLERAPNARGIGAGHDDGALLAKRFRYDLDKALSGLQCGRHELARLGEIGGERMRGSDQHERWLGLRLAEVLDRDDKRQRYASGFQTNASCQIHHPFGRLTRWADHGVHPVWDQVVVRVAQQPVVAEERGKVEGLLCAGAGPASWRKFRARRCFDSRQDDAHRRACRRHELHFDCPRAWIGQRHTFRRLRTGCLISRFGDDGLCGAGGTQTPQPIACARDVGCRLDHRAHDHALELVLTCVHTHRNRTNRGCRDAITTERLAHVVGHLLKRVAFGNPYVRHPPGERARGSTHAGTIAPRDRDNRPSVHGGDRDQPLPRHERRGLQRGHVEPGALEPGGTDRDDGPLGWLAAQWDVHGHRLEAESRRHVRRRGDLVQRRRRSEDHGRGNEVDDLVAVSVLEKRAGSEDLVECGERGIGGACAWSRHSEGGGDAGSHREPAEAR